MVEKDQNYVYIILEYCDGGDLMNVQAKFKEKVYPLDVATEYLSQVIKGL
jgi:serine/threonine protein kinase